MDLQSRHWSCCSVIVLGSIPHHAGNTAWPFLGGEPSSILLSLLPSTYVGSPGSGSSKCRNWSKNVWRWIVLSIPSPDWCHLSGKNTPLRDSFAVCFHIVYLTDFRAHVNCYPPCPAQRHSEMFCQPCEGLFSFLRFGLETHQLHSYSLFLVGFPLPLSGTHNWKISALLLISVTSQ